MRSSFVCSEIFCFCYLELYTYKSINCLHVIYHIVPITKQLNSNNLNNVESFNFTWQMKCRSRLVLGAYTLSQ